MGNPQGGCRKREDIVAFCIANFFGDSLWDES